MKPAQRRPLMAHADLGIKTTMNRILKTTTAVLTLSTSLFLVSSTTQASIWPAELKSDMEKAGIAIADKWIKGRDPEGEAWAWGEGVLSYGLAKMAHTTEKDSYLDWLNAYNTHHDATGKNMEWSDHLSPGIAALYITQNLDPHHEIKTISIDVVDYIMTAPRSPTEDMLIHFGTRYNQFPYNVPGYPEAWVDTLFHVTSNLVLYTQITGDNQYLEEAIHQVSIFSKNLQDPNTSLFAHAVFDKPSKDYEVPSFDSNTFWARGNGWALVSLVELLEAMPNYHPKYQELLDRALRLESALRAAQGNDGRYHTLLTRSNTYYETAASALITYAMAKGYSNGIFGEDTRDAVIKGANGLLDKTLKWDRKKTTAKVKYTSIGTNPDAWAYTIIPRKSNVNYGVGAWLLLTSEFID